jgi:hypothetical protein
MHIGDPQLHYETLESRARPARVAVLMDSSDADWHHAALRIIEFLSSIWGGKHSVIIPTDGSTINTVFWAILERFSPDYVYVYRKTGAHIKASHPEKYAALLQQRVDRYSGFSTLEGEKVRLDRDLQNSWADSFGLSTQLCAQIAERLVPFHFRKNFDPITSTGYLPNELTGIIDVIPCVDYSRFFVSFEVPTEVSPVWWAAHTGAYPKALSDQLRSVYLNEETVRVSGEDMGGFAGWIADGAPKSSSAEVNEILGGKPGFMPPDQTRPTPFDISMSCIGLYGSPLSSRDIGDHFAFVLGDSVSDFCLSYCLPRIGHRAAWLPSAWVDSLQSKSDGVLRSCVFSILYAVPYDVRCGAGVKACSTSRSMQQILETFEVVKKYTNYGLNDEQFTPAEPINVVTGKTAVLTPYCVDSPNHSEIYPFLGDRSVGAIRSPRPNGFSMLNATKHRWVAEIIVRGRAVPTIPDIAEKLVIPPYPSETYAVRVSQQALAYVCPGLLIIGDDINANLQNPEIGLFDTFTAVSVIAGKNGYACQLSDKGIYQRDSFEKFGGVSKAANLLRDKSSRAVFDKFLDHSKRPQGTYDEGCVLDARTYLDLSAAEKVTGGDQDAAVRLFDNLVAAKIAYRGFVLGCGVCKHVSWYSLADLRDDFSCTRCGRKQTISRQHWRQPAAPQIFYKLDEIVYQFLKNDGDVVTLGLDYMARNSKFPFDYCPEIEFRRNDSLDGEIDVCAVYDGVLTIGEAKKTGELASSTSEARRIINKYARLAKMLNARRVFFCTTSKEWKSSTIDTVREGFRENLAVPMFVAAEQLLCKPSPDVL